MKFQFSTVTVLGIPFINTTNDTFVHQLFEEINTDQNIFVVTANPEIVMYADEHPEYAEIIKQADYITPDGIGIIKGAQILGQPLQERITGYDTFLSLLDWADANHKSAFFVGAKPEVMNDLRTTLQEKYPNLVLAGTYDGYFETDEHIVAAIQLTQPDMVFAALGFPKQEEFIIKNRHLTNALWMGLGGSFDVLSGHVQRAPKFWQRAHAEWLYRVLKEPWRIKRLMVLPKYLSKVRKSK
ncbi:WecB/TagA/CpsF family glycosyltransferase [Secundilactobacillus oryzae]|uniref:WecB/TagA/CpsF family glycosyltransferase n=1 Tax=Secundilactobacillus oryzae TaxID=1202668 RepID=UPI000550A6A4|nr:WecB/TagA/CpsF family glycosyltransferase [Secundilactobacillus oryzae]